MRKFWSQLGSVPTYRYIQGAVFLVLAIAFATSFESGSDGAKTLGYAPGYQASLPLVCDVVAGVATFIHGRVRGDQAMRRLAAQFVLGPMLLSWGANALSHAAAAPATSTEVWQQALWIGAVVLGAGICPVAVAALLHLSTKYVEFELRQAEKASRARPVRDERPSAPVPAAPTPETKKARVTSGGTAREWAVANWPCTGAEVQLATKVKKASAYRIVRQLREERELVS